MAVLVYDSFARSRELPLSAECSFPQQPNGALFGIVVCVQIFLTYHNRSNPVVHSINILKYMMFLFFRDSIQLHYIMSFLQGMVKVADSFQSTRCQY